MAGRQAIEAEIENLVGRVKYEVGCLQESRVPSEERNCPWTNVLLQCTPCYTTTWDLTLPTGIVAKRSGAPRHRRARSGWRPDAADARRRRQARPFPAPLLPCAVRGSARLPISRRPSPPWNRRSPCVGVVRGPVGAAGSLSARQVRAAIAVPIGSRERWSRGLDPSGERLRDEGLQVAARARGGNHEDSTHIVPFRPYDMSQVRLTSAGMPACLPRNRCRTASLSR